MSLETLPPLREVIATHGLAARKSLGQNFLLDLNLTGKIARQAGDLSGHDVLEIGPGPGGLTRALLAEGARKVVAIEADPRCLPALAEIGEAAPERLTVLSGDALKLDPLAHLQSPIKVVANLPYNVGTELLVRWLTPSTWPPFWDSLTLMFQKEVAERIVAQPGSKAYGRLAVLSQFRSDPHICFELSPQAFSPPPKVTSAVVHIKALSAPRFNAEPKLLSEVVARAFNQRRKMLRASLKGIVPEVQPVLESVGIDPQRRAETVSLEEFCRLSEAIREARA
ncbi:MAG: 16S rRNA (adenine(1518)-N(6)/adenine(1519)-N(6))-dimethyltransferase RsmA [Rhodobacteraceae bacterium]|nr:16S rRNA (adenine(1518)-N(6)/adenine(1519)-N(6))-dimethyltransferase RsmA [Paracoccaceae bacterium]